MHNVSLKHFVNVTFQVYHINNNRFYIIVPIPMNLAAGNIAQERIYSANGEEMAAGNILQTCPGIENSLRG